MESLRFVLVEVTMSYTNPLRILCMLASVFGAALVSVAPVLSQTPYYAGKTIAIIRGGGPGGSGEFQSRALMPYLQKYTLSLHDALPI